MIWGLPVGVGIPVVMPDSAATGMPTPTGKPQIIPFQLVDAAGGHVLAQAVLAALLNRERHGAWGACRSASRVACVGFLTCLVQHRGAVVILGERQAPQAP
ncbi:hypothetical protein MAHJHV51_57140 [Mycobacterium avium subsp. hominissuis]